MRDLFDSMYKGFPVGYLLFWETGAEAGARHIGTDSKQSVPRLLIVDGQQRLTSLFAVMTGTPIVKEDYTSGRIRVAFRPADATFTDADAATDRDPDYLADISDLWSPEPGHRKKVIRTYLKRLGEKRGLSEAEEDRLEDAIDRLHDLRNYPFKVVELSPDVDEEQVAEVFVRINSEGVTLNQADFILTLMSVFWDKGRHELEDFCRAAKQPSVATASPFNWFIAPQPPQLLRVSVALAFRRAVLRQVYSLLRGKPLDKDAVSAEARDQRFDRLRGAQAKVLDLTNWHEYLQCVERAGYRSSKMISSDNVLLYSYALWLIGRVDYGVPMDRLREVIARWFFMAAITARYSGSFESRFEQDTAPLRAIGAGDADGFVSVLEGITRDTLTADFWSIALPNELSTSASKSPVLMAYIAALNILDADALLATGKVRARLDPAIIAKKGIERHHLFPRNYLMSTLGLKDVKQINQIANMALVEWSDNISISDAAPAEYWPEQVEKKRKAISPDRLARQEYLHALPAGWQSMSYQDFLSARRRCMARVTRDAFEQLADVSYEPEYPPPSPQQPQSGDRTWTSYGVKVSDLIANGLVAAGTSLVPSQTDIDGAAMLLSTAEST